jgi:hypothetical protein
MPAFSDERLIDAAGAVVADRPEQRPVLVVAVASRLEVVVDAPPYPSHGAFCRSRALDREHQAVSALAQAPVVMLVTISWRLWAARRSPAFRSAEHDVLKQHHEEPEREASRCLVRAAVLVCVRDDLMPDRLLPGRQVPVIFRIARDCEADHTAAAVGKRHAADIVCLYASVRPHGG